MKLLLCLACQDIVKFGDQGWRFCRCGQSSARYIDDLHGEIRGDKAVPLGLANGSLSRALHRRPEFGPGCDFTAFVIEKQCPTIRVAPADVAAQVEG